LARLDSTQLERREREREREILRENRESKSKSKRERERERERADSRFAADFVLETHSVRLWFAFNRTPSNCLHFRPSRASLPCLLFLVFSSSSNCSSAVVTDQNHLCPHTPPTQINTSHLHPASSAKVDPHSPDHPRIPVNRPTATFLRTLPLLIVRIPSLSLSLSLSHYHAPPT
jgi:hypothetical protein